MSIKMLEFIRKWKIVIILVIILELAVQLYFYFMASSIGRRRHFSETTKIAFTSCGSRNEESVVMVKSVLLLTKRKTEFHIFTDSWSYFSSEIRTLQRMSNKSFSYSVYNVSFPNDTDVPDNVWRNLFAPCASQRLFMHSILRDVDAVLYVDTDIVFLSPPEQVWDHFENFNLTQTVGIAPEQIEGHKGFYDNWQLPIYGSKGVNSGVMLLNLTRIRSRPWHSDLVSFYVKHKKLIRVGDQDLLNVYLHHNPEKVYTFPCELNYRSNFCTGAIACKQAPRIMHGNRRIMHSNVKKNLFGIVHQAMKQYNISQPTVQLLEALCNGVRQADTSGCGKAANLFIEELFHNLDEQFYNNRSNCVPNSPHKS